MSSHFQMIKKGLKEMAVEKEKYQPEIENPAESDVEYPWGLRLNFDKEVLKLLNKRASDFKVGDCLKLECRADIISIRSSTGRHDSSENLELQITHMEVEEGEKEDGR